MSLMDTPMSLVEWRTEGLSWSKDPPAAEWDSALAALFGHPLQSSVWGRARAIEDGIVEHRWLLRRDGRPVWMMRVEERSVGGLAKVAWAPRGPTAETRELCLSAPPGLTDCLRAEGFSLLITDPWREADNGAANPSDVAGPSQPRTIWIDLSPGEEAVFQGLDAETRKKLRRAERRGVVVEATSDPARISEFIDLCTATSERKGFELRMTRTMIPTLFSLSASSQCVEPVLFVALKDGMLGYGLFLLRVGRSMHQIWSSTNREFLQERAGEACHWGALKYAIARDCTRYDLEGIDPVNNPSTYEFKKRWGGDEVTLYGQRRLPLNILGRVVSLASNTLDRLRR